MNIEKKKKNKNIKRKNVKLKILFPSKSMQVANKSTSGSF